MTNRDKCAIIGLVLLFVGSDVRYIESNDGVDSAKGEKGTYLPNVPITYIVIPIAAMSLKMGNVSDEVGKVLVGDIENKDRAGKVGK